MDQKKTLWIIAAVGAFLLVVLGAALIMYAPANRTPAAVASVSAPANTNNTRYESGWAATSGIEAPSTQLIPSPYGTQDTHVQEMIVVSDNTKVYNTPSETNNDSTTIDLNTLKQEMLVKGDSALQVQTPQVTQPQNINITVNIPETETHTNTFYSETKTVEITPAPVNQHKAEPKTESKASKPETKKPVPAKEVKTVTKTTTVKTTTTTEPAKITQFWVQVAAYSNKKGAENARTILDDNKIPADIFTFKDNKGTLYYRVRVGPYTTKSEAEYWRTRIIQINEFSKAESFVTSTTN